MVTDARPSRADYYRVLADSLPAHALVVTSLGNASYLWAVTASRAGEFLLRGRDGPRAARWRSAWRSRNRTRRVIAVEGDGALLMHMGALVTVGAVEPGNLTVLLIQNGVHAASGGQALTNATLDLAAAGARVGHRHAENMSDAESTLPPAHAPPADQRDGAQVLVLSTEPDIEVVRPPIALDPVRQNIASWRRSARRVISRPCSAAGCSSNPSRPAFALCKSMPVRFVADADRLFSHSDIPLGFRTTLRS